MSDFYINSVYNRPIFKEEGQTFEITINGIEYPIGHLDKDELFKLRNFLKKYDVKNKSGVNDNILSEEEQKMVNIRELKKIIYNSRTRPKTKNKIMRDVRTNEFLRECPETSSSIFTSTVGKMYPKDIGNANFEKKEYKYDIPSLKGSATLSIFSNNYSEDKTAWLKINMAPSFLGAGRSLSYVIAYNNNKVAYLCANSYGQTDLIEPLIFETSFSTNAKNRILLAFAELEKLEKLKKDPERLYIIKIMRSGMEQIKPSAIVWQTNSRNKY